MEKLRTPETTGANLMTHDPTTGRRRLGGWIVRTAIAIGVVAVLIGGGAALAAWNVTGSGEGSAGAASSTPLEDVEVTITAFLYPGLTTAATLAVTNPNPFPVRLTDIVFTELTVLDGTDPHLSCSVVNSQVTFTDITGVSDSTYFIDADDSESFTLTGAVTMGTGADDACQGAIFAVEVDLTAESTTPPAP